MSLWNTISGGITILKTHDGWMVWILSLVLSLFLFLRSSLLSSSHRMIQRVTSVCYVTIISLFVFVVITVDFVIALSVECVLIILSLLMVMTSCIVCVMIVMFCWGMKDLLEDILHQKNSIILILMFVSISLCLSLTHKLKQIIINSMEFFSVFHFNSYESIASVPVTAVGIGTGTSISNDRKGLLRPSISYSLSIEDKLIHTTEFCTISPYAMNNSVEFQANLFSPLENYVTIEVCFLCLFTFSPLLFCSFLCVSCSGQR